MRHFLANKTVLGLLLLVCAAFSASNASAAQIGDYRYRSWIDENNVIFRFDNLSGDIEKLVKAPSGPPMWVRCEIQQTKQAAAVSQTQTIALSNYLPAAPVQAAPVQYAPAPKPIQNINAAPSGASAQLIEPMMTDSMAYKSEPTVVKTSGKRIELFDENNNNITDEINEADRVACRNQITGYDKSMSLISTIGIGGERTTGILTLSNNGTRKIKTLEVSILASPAGQDKPVAIHRILFAENKAGCEKPPVPAESSYGNSKVSKRIDIATPPGTFTGKPDVRVTFIKFED